MIAGEAPISASSFGAKIKKGSPSATDAIAPRKIACTAEMAAPSPSFSPMRRATIAVVDMPSPMPTAKTSVSTDSVSPTVAIAFEPSRLTQNTSTTANRDSSTISSTIGIASSRIDRFSEPAV